MYKKLLCFPLVFIGFLSSFGQDDVRNDKYQMDFRPYQYNQIWGGEKIDTLFPSRMLGYAKNVTIFTPYEFRELAGETYPLIVVNDRWSGIVTDHLLHSIDLLMRFGQIPRSVVVGIESGGASDEPNLRTKEAKWSIDGGEVHGEKYDQFVFDELIPYMKQHYSIDNNQIIIFGHSWFGYHTAMLLIHHIPDLFAVISACPCCLKSPRIDDIVQAVANCGPLERKFFFRVASGHDIGDDLDVYRELTGKLSLARLPENFDYKTTWHSAAFHGEVPGLLLIQSLYEIYTDWADLGYAFADPANHPTYDDARLYDSLQNISDRIYGFHIPISDIHLKWRVEYYRYIKNEEVKNNGKIATWKFMISKYGENPELYYNIAETYLLLKKPDETRLYLEKVKKSGADKEMIRKAEELEDKLNHL